MCEPSMLHKTGLRSIEHQTRTLTSYEELLQFTHDLGGGSFRAVTARPLEPRRAVRSVRPCSATQFCRRRHHVPPIEDARGRALSRLACAGLRRHGFGMKTSALSAMRDPLASADLPA